LIKKSSWPNAIAPSVRTGSISVTEELWAHN
jgi:hypothetical protein